MRGCSGETADQAATIASVKTNSQAFIVNYGLMGARMCLSAHEWSPEWLEREPGAQLERTGSA